MMARRRLSVAFWIVVTAILLAVDVFYTPTLMNHAHGMLRWLGFVIGGVTVLPIGILVARIVQRVRVLFFTKRLPFTNDPW